GGRLRLGEDRGDRLTAIADSLTDRRQHELLFGLDADQAEDRVDVVRHVVCRDGTDEAGDLLGCREIQRAQPRVVRWAADHLEGEHPWKCAIGGEARSTGEVTLGVAPDYRLTDDVQRAHGTGSGSGCGAAAAVVAFAAASWIAATIGSYPVQ